MVPRALDVVVDPGVVAADIELEDAEVVGGGGGGLESRIADGAQHMRYAELGRGLGGGGAAAGIEALDGADGRQHYRGADAPAEQAPRAVDLRDVSQHPWPEGDRVERLAVPLEGGLGLGAAHQVVPGAGRQVLPGGLHDLLERLELVFHALGHS